jgi:hypothetical protein
MFRDPRREHTIQMFLFLVSVVIRICLCTRCHWNVLGETVGWHWTFADFTIPAFRRHVTIFYEAASCCSIFYWMVRWLMNWKWFWRKRLGLIHVQPHINTKELRKTTKILVQDNRCSDRNSNQASLECCYTELLLRLSVQWYVILFPGFSSEVIR